MTLSLVQLHYVMLEVVPRFLSRKLMLALPSRSKHPTCPMEPLQESIQLTYDSDAVITFDHQALARHSEASFRMIEMFLLDTICHSNFESRQPDRAPARIDAIDIR